MLLLRGLKTAVFQDDDLKDGLGQAVAEVDQDKSGQIDFEEFCSLVRRTEPHLRHTTAELRRRFDEVDADKGGTIDAAEFEDPITHPADAMLSAFGAATQRMPFALVHPFGEQGWRVYSGGRRDPSEPKPQHSNLSFGALIFFTDSKDVRKAVSDVPSQDRIPRRKWAAIEREKREQCCTFNFVQTERVLTLDPYGDPQRHVRELRGSRATTRSAPRSPLTISFAELMRANADPRTPRRRRTCTWARRRRGPRSAPMSSSWSRTLGGEGAAVQRADLPAAGVPAVDEHEGKNVYEKKFVWLDYWCGSPRGLTPRLWPTCRPRLSPPPTLPLSGRCRRRAAFTWLTSSASSTRPTRCARLVARQRQHAVPRPPRPPRRGRRVRAASGRSSRRGARRSSSAPTAASRRRRGCSAAAIVLAADDSGADRTALAFGRMAEKDARRAREGEVLVTNQGDKIVSFAKMRRLGIRAKEEKRRSSRDGYGEERRSSREPPLPAAGGGSRPYGGAGGFRYY